MTWLTSCSLFNLSSHSADTSLVVHLPALPSSHATGRPQLPEALLRNWPVASINYRWDELSDLESSPQQGTWPAPVHDTAFAYAWITANLGPPPPARRDIYVYGSFLGASLAMSLALTESTSHAPFGVRGVATYNGVYNWTMFLPDHPVHKRKKATIKDALAARPLAEGARLEELSDAIPLLFREPSNLFDAFASPSLFFHNPGLHVPSSFDANSSPLSDVVSLMTGQETEQTPEAPPKPPRKSHLVFPPRISTLKIPETLLLYDRYHGPPQKGRRSSKRRGHTYATQAAELAELMRRSIDKVELKERSKWDDETDSWDGEARRRVQVEEIDEETDGFYPGKEAQERLMEWLEERA